MCGSNGLFGAGSVGVGVFDLSAGPLFVGEREPGLGIAEELPEALLLPPEGPGIVVGEVG